MANYRFNTKQYRKFTSDLNKFKRDYVVIQSGITERFIYKGNTYRLMDEGLYGGAGHHLSILVKKDVDLWLLNNKDKLEPRLHDYKEQFFSLDAIEKNIGQPCMAYDVGDCYWNTAYKLGFITERTYIMGKKNSKWKLGRVAAIGSLAKTEVHMPYVNGLPDFKLKETVKTPIEYQYVRNNIIGYVYDMFYRLYQEIGDKQFFMFLTDCVYFDISQINYIKKFFNNRGFKIRAKSIEFYEVDRKKKAVGWFDYSEEDENKRKKYYQYNDLQLKF